MRLLADVSSLRHDPQLQKLRLIDGLNDLLRTQLGVWIEMDDWRPKRNPRAKAQILTSDPDPYWVRYMSDFTVNHSAHDDPYADHSIRSKARTQVWQFEPLVANAESQRRYGATLDMARKLKIRDGVVSILRMGESGDSIVGFSLQRRVEFGKLTKREMAVADLAIREIGDMIRRGSLCAQLEKQPALPPRLRDVLERLLRGQSPVLMARSMGISVHTLREHVGRLYMHFKVNSREELMAKFVR